MLLGTLSASLLGNLITGKGATKSTSQGRVVNKKGKGIISWKAGKGIIRAGSGNNNTDF